MVMKVDTCFPDKGISVPEVSIVEDEVYMPIIIMIIMTYAKTMANGLTVLCPHLHDCLNISVIQCDANE